MPAALVLNLHGPIDSEIQTHSAIMQSAFSLHEPGGGVDAAERLGIDLAHKVAAVDGPGCTHEDAIGFNRRSV